MRKPSSKGRGLSLLSRPDSCSHRVGGGAPPGLVVCPERCEHGHRVGPGRCWCRGSGATAPRPAWGHLTVECAEPGCRSKCFSPRHEPGVNGPGTGARPAAVPDLRAAVWGRVPSDGSLLTVRTTEPAAALHQGLAELSLTLWLGVIESPRPDCRGVVRPGAPVRRYRLPGRAGIMRTSLAHRARRARLAVR